MLKMLLIGGVKMELCIGIALVVLSIGITVFLISIARYSICIHKKRIEVRPTKTNFNSNTNEDKA